jgi:xanthine dehydrogenase accessory factor
VSGGCVEGAVAEEILASRASGRERVIRYGISDEQAWDVGLACGGTIDVLVSPTVPTAVVAAARAAATGEGIGRAVCTVLPPDAAGSAAATPLVVHGDGSLEGSLEDSLGDASADAALVVSAIDLLKHGVSRVVDIGGRAVFVEVFPPRPRLVVVGAVEVARPLVRLARELGYATVVVDGRAAFATAERFADVDQLVVGWPDEVADAIGLGPADAVAILTHDVKFDQPAIIESLARGCRYVGAIGSRKTQAERRGRLLAAGVAADALDRLRGPVGLDLGGRQPAETALAIMAEIVAERRGGSGLPLRDVASGRLSGVPIGSSPGTAHA